MTKSTGWFMYKLYRHNLYRHKLYRHKLYREQIVSGTNCIGSFHFTEKDTFLSKLIKESDKHISFIKLLLYLCIYSYTLHVYMLVYIQVMLTLRSYVRLPLNLFSILFKVQKIINPRHFTTLFIPYSKESEHLTLCRIS